MIHEFAVEPAALSEFNPVWQALEQFGVDHGRLISQFPKGWLGAVYEAIKPCPDYEKKSLEIRLTQLRRKVVRFRRNRPSDPELSWRENAHVEDRANSFHAIIQNDNLEKHERVITAFDLHDGSSLWKVKTQDNVARTPESLAAVLGPLGKISKELLFVDPHFSTEARWSKVFVECLCACGATEDSHYRIEVHTGAVPGRRVLEASVKRWIVPRLPLGLSIRFVLWEQKELGEKLHARYFLTERGGIRFDVGLDEGEPGETTDVSLLAVDLYEARWAGFHEPSAAYAKVDEFTVGAASQ